MKRSTLIPVVKIAILLMAGTLAWFYFFEPHIKRLRKAGKASLGKADETPPKKKIVLPPNWSTLEIQTGQGSCWGESTHVYLTLNRTASGGTGGIRTADGEEKQEPRKVDAEELKRIADRLVAYCSYFSDNGSRAPNHWLLHKIEFTRDDSEKRELLYEGPSLLKDTKSEEFHRWLRSLHPKAKPLTAESYWTERRE